MLKINHTNVVFTSDYHLWHKNIIKFSNRPFDDVMEMNEVIRDNHNRVCDDDTIVFNLGDAILLPREHELDNIDIISFLRTFKGRRIHYVRGNHEREINTIESAWSRPTYDYLEVEVDLQKIVLCHYAFRIWNGAHKGWWHLYGHSHGGLKNDAGKSQEESPYGLSMDVGVDCNNFYPFTFDQVLKKMEQKVFRPNDHHVLVRK